MSLWREPEAWRVLPSEVKRTVVTDVGRGVAPADPRVAAATRAWAEWTLRAAKVRLATMAVVFALALALAAAYRPSAFGLAMPLVLAAAALLEQRRARRALAALDGARR